MYEHKMPSGAVLDVTPLSHEKAWGVTRQLLRVVERLNVDVRGLDFKAIMAQDVLNFKGPICAVLAADEVQDAARACLERCTYSGAKITTDTFEARAARGDFLFAVFYALKENVSPFFESALLFFETQLPATADQGRTSQ